MKNSVVSLFAAAALAATLSGSSAIAAPVAATPAASGPATTTAPVAPARGTKAKRDAGAPKEAGAPKPVSAGQTAMRERQKKCGAEWREAKTAGKVEKGMKWPQYWSACNKRLKAGA